ncbi:aminoacyl-tRNA hydrolase [bacterium]|nr:aminoacyl-tRNA hydrolase [bacterium]
MKLIVGLGNPGRRYAATAHNMGFEVVDRLARRWGMAFRMNERYEAEIADGQLARVAAMLVKPQTFMNLSGKAVAAIARQRELGSDDLLVITDDVNLPIGRLRIRAGGRAGGHNGLKSIIACLGSDTFARLRVGIHPGEEIDDLVQYVLAKLPPEERRRLDTMLDLAADAVEHWVANGTVSTADRYNGMKPFDAAPGDDV